MIIPTQGKVLVKMQYLRHTYLYTPTQEPTLSVAEIVNARDMFPVGAKVLIPTKAGINISKNGETMRLINSEDIVASIVNQKGG